MKIESKDQCSLYRKDNLSYNTYISFECLTRKGILYQNASKVNQSDFYSIEKYFTDLKRTFHPIRVYYDFSTHCRFKLLYIPFYCKEENSTNIFLFCNISNKIKYTMLSTHIFAKHIFWIRSYFAVISFWRLCICLETLFLILYDIVRFLTGCPIKLILYCHCYLLWS